VTGGVRIEPWGEGDLPLLEKTLGDPEMTKHLGGPESDEKLAERQVRFERLADSGTGRMFKIVDVSTGESVGSVGYWGRTWRDEEVYARASGRSSSAGSSSRSSKAHCRPRGRLGCAATAQAIAIARSGAGRDFGDVETPVVALQDG
jgi:hypothetical protein